jgi:hypothetical protein
VETRYRSAPGFVASLGGAFAGYFAGAVLALLLLWPFALASSTALAVGSVDGYRGLGGLVLAALVLAAAQVAITAWITQQAASLLGDAPVRFGRALGAVFLGYLANVFVGSAIADVAELPVVGGAWIGLVVVALVISSAPRRSAAPAA